MNFPFGTSKNEPLDFLAVGDIVTEPFIKLTQATVHPATAQEEQQVCMAFGEKIPYESATVCTAVGNSANAAVAAARLGLSSSLRAYVGDDQYGLDCMAKLKEEKVSTEYMVTEPGKHSNYHYVLWYESERTILVKHEEFSYTAPTLTRMPKWLYLSSLADHSQPYHDELARLLAEHPEVKLAFQPGTFQMKLGVEALKPLYERTDLFVVNKEEAERILKLGPDSEIPDLLRGLATLGPKLVIITDGRAGAYAYDAKFTSVPGRMLRVPMYPDSRAPYERTGAGDAFASSVTAALAIGKPLDEALLWGPINSMAVVQEVGAQTGLLTRAQLDEFLAKAPSSYVVSPLS